MTAPDHDELAERVREIMHRLGIEPPPMPLPQDGAAPPPPHWSDDRDEDAEGADGRDH